jgi:hypothetical protein
MSARSLAEAIASYLEADDGGNDGSGGTTVVPVTMPDNGGRMQTQRLAQKIDQLQQDMASLKNNMQMTALLPLLLNQSLSVVSDTLQNGNPGPLQAAETIQMKQSDPLTALLPVLLMGGLGGNGGNGSDNSNNMLLLVLALSGGL